MEKQQYFDDFQQLCINILAESDNCQESQQAFCAAGSVQQLVAAWLKFWSGVIHEVPAQVKTAFARLYSVYKDDINGAGMWYNEQPDIDDNRCIILIGDHPDYKSSDEEQVLTLRGNHRVYVIGNQPVSITGSCRVNISAEDADVCIYDGVNANIERGYVRAYGRSVVNGSGDITCHDAAVITAIGGIVHDHGHYHISVYNDTVVDGFTTNRVVLHDKARLVKR